MFSFREPCARYANDKFVSIADQFAANGYFVVSHISQSVGSIFHHHCNEGEDLWLQPRDMSASATAMTLADH